MLFVFLFFVKFVTFIKEHIWMCSDCRLTSEVEWNLFLNESSPKKFLFCIILLRNYRFRRISVNGSCSLIIKISCSYACGYQYSLTPSLPLFLFLFTMCAGYQLFVLAYKLQKAIHVNNKFCCFGCHWPETEGKNIQRIPRRGKTKLPT